MYRDLDEFRGLREVMASEVARCFSPEIHEGQRRPYGAVIVRDDAPKHVGTLIQVQDQNALRGAADGVNTLAYCVKGQAGRFGSLP